ncbi:MAG: hypothetical protein U5R31_13755 [Acidimicrobiia bacterium]|nr:hypothetical protein [Acidimicrobiia bacterium]
MSVKRTKHGTWKARFRLADGRERAKTFKRKVDAEAWERAQRADISRGLLVDPASGRQRFGDYVAAWQQRQVHRPTTAAQVESIMRSHVLPTFADRPLVTVRPSDVQAWVRGLDLAPATVEVAYRYLAAIFSDAVRDGALGRSPCRGSSSPNAPRSRSCR